MRAAVNDPEGILAVAGGWLRTGDPDGTHQRELLPYRGVAYLDSQPFNPALSHDGTKIAYQIGVGGICVIGVDGTGNRCTGAGGGGAFEPSWSPDDRAIYFTVSWPGGSSVLSMGVDLSHSERFALNDPDGTSAFRNLEWAPDGRHFAVARSRPGGPYKIVIGDADGSSLRPVTAGATEDIDPHWSPDGTRIAYTTHLPVSDPFKVAVVNADGTGERVLRQDVIADAWSPDGSRILFHGSAVAALATMKPDGTGVTSIPGLGGTADWRRPTPKAISVSGGGAHTLSLRADGSVMAWGYNGQGQLGDGTLADKARPAVVRGLPPAASVSAGWVTSAAVGTDGRLWTWGWNGAGQLGTGNRFDSARPVLVPGLTGVGTVSVGLGHTLALRTDGTVWAWGWNGLGQLGDGTRIDRLTPVQINIGRVRAIAAGAGHSLALDADGTVWAWGYNGVGQLGTGSTDDALTPTVVSLPPGGASAVAGGLFHSLALGANGQVFAWGWNAYGQLGDGTTVDRWLPVPSIDSVVTIAAGAAHGLAATLEGRLLAWGYDGQGELGNGTTDTAVRATTVKAPEPIFSVGAGWFHSLAVGMNADVLTWGYNGQGELGNGSTGDGLTPKMIG